MIINNLTFLSYTRLFVFDTVLSAFVTKSTSSLFLKNKDASPFKIKIMEVEINSNVRGLADFIAAFDPKATKKVKDKYNRQSRHTRKRPLSI